MMLRFLIQKEFLQIRRNAFLPRLIVVFPIVMMCVMPWVMNQEVREVRVEVVDHDRSVLSRQLAERIVANPYIDFCGQKETYALALRDIERMEADVVLEIPPHFGRDLARGEHPQILLAANAVNGTKGAIGSSYLSQVVTAHVAPSAMAVKDKVATLYLYNNHLNYKLFMIPALLAIVMMLLCGFLPTLNIVGEKEAGTIEQINVTPVQKWAFILAKLIPYWLIALFVIVVCLLISWALYGITCEGPLGLVFVLAMLLALFWSALGLLISNFSDSMQQAILVMWFFVVCMLLLSGLFTPSRSMPRLAYLTTYVNPMHYFVEAIRTVFIRGGGFSSVLHQLLALAAIAAVVTLCAVGSYRKNG